MIWYGNQRKSWDFLPKEISYKDCRGLAVRIANHLVFLILNTQVLIPRASDGFIELFYRVI